MLKQKIRNTLELVVRQRILHGGGSDTLAFDISRQCISDEDVEMCLGAMLEHVSAEEVLEVESFLKSDKYQRYGRGIDKAMESVDSKIYETLKLLREDALGRA